MKGPAGVIILVLLIVVALGAVVYMASHKGESKAKSANVDMNAAGQQGVGTGGGSQTVNGPATAD